MVRVHPGRPSTHRSFNGRTPVLHAGYWGFDSLPVYHLRRHRLLARSRGSQLREAGSIPAGGTITAPSVKGRQLVLQTGNRSSILRGATISHPKVAQPGSAPASGAGGREFESRLSDHFLGVRERQAASLGSLKSQVRVLPPRPSSCRLLAIQLCEYQTTHAKRSIQKMASINCERYRKTSGPR